MPERACKHFTKSCDLENVYFTDSERSGNDDEGSSSSNDILSLDAALMYDSLLVIANAAKNLEYHMDSILFQDENSESELVSCRNDVPWMEGTTFFNYLNAVSVEGITGNISFQVSLETSCAYQPRT